MRSELKDWKLVLFLISPFLLLITVFYLAPIIITAILSFTSMGSAMRWDFNGIQNFQTFFRDPNIPTVLQNTAIYLLATLGLNVGMGLLLGLLTSYFVQKETIGLIVRTIWMLPRISPPVVYTLIWIWFFDPSRYGILNSLRSLIGLDPVNWLMNQPMTAVVLANGLVGASFGMIIFSSAIKSIPEDMYHAASIDGASQWGIVKDIILPTIKWPVMFVTMWQTLSLVTSYEIILLLTDGGPVMRSEVLALYGYHRAFQYFDYGYGAALSLILVVIALGLAFLIWKVFGLQNMLGKSRLNR